MGRRWPASLLRGLLVSLSTLIRPQGGGLAARRRHAPGHQRPRMRGGEPGARADAERGGVAQAGAGDRAAQRRAGLRHQPVVRRGERGRQRAVRGVRRPARNGGRRQHAGLPTAAADRRHQQGAVVSKEAIIMRSYHKQKKLAQGRRQAIIRPTRSYRSANQKFSSGQLEAQTGTFHSATVKSAFQSPDAFARAH